MWRMPGGDRILTEPEWEVFSTGLDVIRDFVEQDIAAQEDIICTGVCVFDRLTAEQKLAMLAEVASALRDPAIPSPVHTAANEGTIMAVLHTFQEMLRMEVKEGDKDQTELRGILRTAVADEVDPLPKLRSRKWDDWDLLCGCFIERILWDGDFDVEEGFLDLPPEAARAKLKLFGIDEQYFLTVPDEPNEQQLTAARRTLAKLIGLAMP
jgi:hypothetical protein